MSVQPDVTIESAPAVHQPIRGPVMMSGPMSEGIISVGVGDKNRRHRNDTTEHVCMFSVCLMFIGVPIVVAGVLVLNYFPPIGLLMMIVGAIASASGAFVAIVLAAITLCSKSPASKTTSADAYNETQTQPEIVIESTNYSESFEHNPYDEEPEHIQNSEYHLTPDSFPDKLDPVNWSNFPEAQNPKSYLQSFGELPRVMPSPDVRSIKDKKSRHKSSKKVKRKISLSKSVRLGGGRKRTMSRTSLTRDYNDDIEVDSSSLSSTDSSGGVSPNRRAEVVANQSIVTIENLGRDRELSDDSVLAIRSSCDETNDDERKVKSKEDKSKSNGVLTDDIELDQVDHQPTSDDGWTPDPEARNYADLWNDIRAANTPK